MTLRHHSLTSRVYSCIRDCKYDVGIKILQSLLEDGVPRQRELLSLLAYCFYQEEDYLRSSEIYEELLEMCPSSEQYQLYYVQSLVHAESFIDASRAAVSSTVLPSSPFFHQIKLLQAQAEMEQGLLLEAAATLKHCIEEDTDTVLSLAAIHFRNKDYASALDKYLDARSLDDRPIIAYFIALCHYHLEDYEMALSAVNDIIETRVEDDFEDNSCLYYNLKASILYAMKDVKAAKATMKELMDMGEEEEDLLDAVTMHNDAIVKFDTDPAAAIQKLQCIITSQPLHEFYPSEAFGNILIMLLNQGHEDLASETFEAYKHVAPELLPHETYSYVQAAVTSMTSPTETLERSVVERAKRLKLEMKRLRSKKLPSTRAATASIRPTSSRPSSSRPMSSRPSTAVTQRDLARATKEFEISVNEFVPLLMLQAKTLWDQGGYAKTEAFLQQHSEILGDSDVFCENMAHSLFLQQGDKFEESIPYYEMLINSHTEASNLLELPAMALANLCVAYILTNQNEEAEAVMKAIALEEDNALAMGDVTESYHNSIVNLAVGTLYCERGNYDFGISRIIKSLEPFDKNLSPDTWFYTKRCFLALASKISKLMFMMNDVMLHEIIDFFDDVTAEGTNIVLDDIISLTDQPITIASESRQLKQLFMTLSK
eukprot:scaffold556_cov144-Skeletonema_menzelii.AAC.1